MDEENLGKEITFKTDDKLSYHGKLSYFDNEVIKIDDAKCLNGSYITNYKNTQNYYEGNVSFYKSHIVWYYFNEDMK